MSKGIIHTMCKAGGLDSPAQIVRPDIADEQPTLADLVLPGSGYEFSDKFARLLRVLGEEKDLL
jgi:hypothetical protein